MAARYARGLGRLHHAVFAAVVNADARAARAAARSLGAPLIAESLETLLARDSDAIDAVVLRGPHAVRAGLARVASDAGRHLLLAGPLASTSNEARAVVGACRAAGVCLMSGPLLRFLPAHRVIKDRLNAGRLGAPGLVRIHQWRASSDPGRPVPPESRRGRLVGRLADAVDLAAWLFDARPECVYATARPGEAAGLPDYIQVHLGFPGGGMALIDRADTLPAGARPYFAATLIGSRGAAYADDHHNMNLLCGRGCPRSLLTGQGCGHLITRLQEFVDAIRERREPGATGADGCAALEVAEAAARSLDSQAALRWTGERYERE
jgi:predicted dehydrogenase